MLENEPEGQINPVSQEDIELTGEPTPYSPEYGIGTVQEASPESHLEASVLANPALLPDELQPENATLCRQVPISPFKPSNIDEADVAYFNEPGIRDGTIPNTIIELKNSTAGKGAALQVYRYLRWLHDRLKGDANDIEVFVFAPGYTSTFDGYIPDEYQEQIEKIEFGNNSQTSAESTFDQF